MPDLLTYSRIIATSDVCALYPWYEHGISDRIKPVVLRIMSWISVWISSLSFQSGHLHFWQWSNWAHSISQSQRWILSCFIDRLHGQWNWAEHRRSCDWVWWNSKLANLSSWGNLLLGNSAESRSLSYAKALDWYALAIWYDQLSPRIPNSHLIDPSYVSNMFWVLWASLHWPSHPPSWAWLGPSRTQILQCLSLFYVSASINRHSNAYRIARQRIQGHRYTKP